MIKKCPVILNNEYVTVVRYDKKTIQFPSIRSNKSTVYVKCEDDKYFIIEDNDALQQIAGENNNIKKKKTTKKVSVKDEADTTDVEIENA